ncbi:MAG: hypothetical protein R3279_05375 [Putridiphycobacter sp.]|nr:hypothetical protein [Putridiphycobacter sp.]
MYHKEINAFAQKLYNYGVAMKLISVQGGIESSVISKDTYFEDLGNGEMLNEYLQSIVKSLRPDKLIAIVKKSNGKSSLRLPRTFEISFTPLNKQPMYHDEHPNSNLNGAYFQPTSPQPVSAKDALWKDKYQILLLENKKLEAKANAYDQLKDENRDLKADLKTIETKHKLDQQIAELASKNSLAGVFKEAAPLLKDIATSMAANKPNGGQEQLSGTPLNQYAKEIVAFVSNPTLGENDAKTIHTIFALVIPFLEKDLKNGNSNLAQLLIDTIKSLS